MARTGERASTVKPHTLIAHFPTTGELGYAFMVTVPQHKCIGQGYQTTEGKLPNSWNGTHPFPHAVQPLVSKGGLSGHVRLVTALLITNLCSRTLAPKSALPELPHSLALTQMPSTTGKSSNTALA